MDLPFGNLIRVKILDIARGTNQAHTYEQLLNNQYTYTKAEIEKYQSEHLNKIFRHHYENNDAYRAYVTQQGYIEKGNIKPLDIPIITKDFFRNHSNDHFIKEYSQVIKHSGGSTGIPLPIHLSKNSIDNFWPSIWRSFDVYDIKPCDKIMMIAGPSLFNNRSIKRKIYDYVNRFNVISAFDLSQDTLEYAYQQIRKHKIKAIYGYTSSILVFLNFLEKNKYVVDLKCIFTTSETFIPSIRSLAKRYCNCDVIDTYGANDGGVFGYECQFHTGYHLNFERCFVEIIDNEIICTDLLNTASPFIRYKVGDYTTSDIIKEQCNCGRTLFRIQDIAGKVNQFIEDIDHVKIHCGFFTQLFRSDTSIKQYQITQINKTLEINIIHDNLVNDNSFVKKYTDSIKKRFKMPFKIVFNKPIKTLANMKTPILIKEDSKIE